MEADTTAIVSSTPCRRLLGLAIARRCAVSGFRARIRPRRNVLGSPNKAETEFRPPCCPWLAVSSNPFPTFSLLTLRLVRCAFDAVNLLSLVHLLLLSLPELSPSDQPARPDHRSERHHRLQPILSQRSDTAGSRDRGQREPAVKNAREKFFAFGASDCATSHE